MGATLHPLTFVWSGGSGREAADSDGTAAVDAAPPQRQGKGTTDSPAAASAGLWGRRACRAPPAPEGRHGSGTDLASPQKRHLPLPPPLLPAVPRRVAPPTEVAKRSYPLPSPSSRTAGSSALPRPDPSHRRPSPARPTTKPTDRHRTFPPTGIRAPAPPMFHRVQSETEALTNGKRRWEKVLRERDRER